MRPAPDCPVGYLEIGADRKILASGGEAPALLGYAPDELVGRPLNDVMPLAARVFFQTHVFPTLALKGRVDEVYIPVRTKSGERVPVLLNAVRRAADDQFLDVLVFMTMQRRLLFESELVRARREAERSANGERAALDRVHDVETQLAVSERLASLGTLAAGVAHEINNPLAYILLNLDILSEMVAEEPFARDTAIEVLADVRSGVEQLCKIAANLKTLSRVDDARREPVDLAHVATFALRFAGTEIRHRARIQVDLEDPAPVVLGDEGRLCQVAINLLVNAVQAMRERPPSANVVRVVVRSAASGRALLEVIDNGPGVPKGLEERIFHPFFTTKPAGEGTGLGLSVCHEIVASLGGALTLEPSPIGGACFRVSLPLCGFADPAAPIGDGKPSVQEPPSVSVSARRVLAVDDDHTVLRVLSRSLDGCDVATCSNGAAALARLSADGFDAFDVILCDLMMPGMSGEELYSRIRERSPQAGARTIFMTGGTFTEADRRFLEDVDNRILSKPFTTRELRAACEDIVARSTAEAADRAPGKSH